MNLTRRMKSKRDLQLFKLECEALLEEAEKMLAECIRERRRAAWPAWLFEAWESGLIWPMGFLLSALATTLTVALVARWLS